jgi:aminopeptidase N
MTIQLGALRAMLQISKGQEQLRAFEQKWQDDRLVMDKWFGLQTSLAAPEMAAQTARALTTHSAFDVKNPNRFRAVFGGLLSNTAGFHHVSGDAYDLLADWLIKLDAINPQTTARMTKGFDTWKQFDANRQSKMQNALTRIAQTPRLSGDTTEMVTRILG